MRALRPLLLAVAALAAAGCQLWAPPREDTLQVRQAVRYMDEGLRLEEQARQQHLEVLQEGWLRAVNGEVDQALMDDLRRLEAEGKLTQEAVQAAAAAAAAVRGKNTADAMAVVKAARDARSPQELRQVWASLRLYLLARLGQDEVRADLAGQLEQLAQELGLKTGGR